MIHKQKKQCQTTQEHNRSTNKTERLRKQQRSEERKEGTGKRVSNNTGEVLKTERQRIATHLYKMKAEKINKAK